MLVTSTDPFKSSDALRCGETKNMRDSCKISQRDNCHQLFLAALLVTFLSGKVICAILKSCTKYERIEIILFKFVICKLLESRKQL